MTRGNSEDYQIRVSAKEAREENVGRFEKGAQVSGQFWTRRILETIHQKRWEK